MSSVACRPMPMRKIQINRPTIPALAALLAFGVAGCSKPPVEESVATVNGEAIPMKEYYAFLERKPTVQVSTPQGPQEVQVSSLLGLQALRDLINQKLILQLAKEDGVLPTEADVKAELDFQEQQRGKFVSTLTAQGLSLEAIKEELLFNLARERLQTKGITIGAAEVDKYIKENPQQFMEPEKASLLWIVISDATKKALVDKDLQSGQDFRTVATRYSEAPGARQDGGAFGTDLVAQMPTPLQELVKATPELKATKWVQDQQNWIKFYVQKKTPAKKMEMTETRKKALQRQLALQRGSAANDVTKRVTDKLRAAKIDVSPKHLREPWEKAFEEAKNQMAQAEAANRATPPAAPTTPTSPTPAPGATPGKTTG
ncbi:MAG: SurA N-terminal domain-containing protein [Fimbriimonas sp.]